MTVNVAIVGGSGYGGGELLRLLLGHPQVSVSQVTSERYAGKSVARAHPNLRGVTNIRFCTVQDLKPCDFLFLALPHGHAMAQLDHFQHLAPRLIDLSGDFRLGDQKAYEMWYQAPHTRPEALNSFVYGIPEVNRNLIGQADWVAGAGCNATITILGLLPLFRARVVEQAVVEVKVGSSEGGNTASDASHHPERAGAVRSYKPTGHRHIAEMQMILGHDAKIAFSATSIEMVRGILATCHVFLSQDLDEKAVWRLFSTAYGQEPFIRIVKERRGIYRYPEPKLLAGTNFCDIGFEKDAHSNRLMVICAIDNLMKGAAGQALQCFNLMQGFDEDTGLGFTGLHPI